MNFVKESLVKNITPFLPLLVLHIILILVFAKGEFVGDEGRYIDYATNLTNGFYTSLDDPSLRNGPGYPLVLTLPVLFNAPFVVIRILNAFFFVAAVVFFYKTLRFYLKPKKAMALAYLFGLYPPALNYMIGILSESLTLLLVCGFLYYFIRLHKETSKRTLHIILSASFLGMLTLTKVIFGYVILPLLVFLLVLLLLKRSNKVKHSLFVIIGSFMLCVPYLAYTYSVTKKAFLWGTGGGEVIYWRSSPVSNELGNWISEKHILGNDQSEHFSTAELSKNHIAFFKKLAPLTNVQRDSAFKARALENIKKHPIKYLKNTGISASRLFFNYPYSYTPQKMSSLFYMIPNMFLMVFLLLAIYLALINRNRIPFEVWFCALIAFIFLGGLTLLDGRVRHFLPMLPVLLFCIAYSFDQFLEVKINRSPNASKTKIL